MSTTPPQGPPKPGQPPPNPPQPASLPDDRVVEICAGLLIPSDEAVAKLAREFGVHAIAMAVAERRGLKAAGV